MSVRIEKLVTATPAPSEPALEDPGFVDFTVAGAAFAGELRCADCGYGAIVQRTVPSCPMCGGTIWERRSPLERRSAG